MKEIKKKVVAMVAVITMMMSYVAMLGEEVYAAYEELEEQGRGTNQKQVEMDVYLKEGEKEVHRGELVIGQIGKVRIRIGVKEGYLKGGQISLKETNYKLEEGVEAGGIVKGINVEEGKIELNDIEKDQEVEIELPIEYKEKGSIVESELKKVSKVGLEGTYVDSNGKERKVEGEKKVRIEWRGEGEAVISSEQEKYIETEEGMIIVRRIQAGIKDNTIGVKKETIEVKVPEIEGVKAEEVKVIGRSLRGSKKEERAESFGKENYEYRKEEGKVRIEIENKETEEGRAVWGEGYDEFIVVSEYKGVKAEGKEIEVEGRVEIEGYGVEGKRIGEEKKTEKVEKKGQIVSGEIAGSNKKSKGYLYANNGINGVEYTSEWRIEIGKAGERVEATAGEDRIVTDKGEEGIGENGEYKRIEIEKRGVEKVIGETGKLEIYNEKGEKIGEVNKESQTNEAGKVVIEGQGAKGIKVVVEKAEEEGILYIEAIKGIKSKTSYSREEVRKMRAIKTEQRIGEERKEQEIELTETESRARVEVTQKTLSSIGKNEKVEITGILQRNREDCDLYQNPTIEFVMPKEVTEVELVGVNLLYSNLKKVGQEVKELEDGRKVIEVRIEGEEREYLIGRNEEGSRVQVLANITLDRKATSKASKIEMRYTNEKAVNMVNGGVTETGIEIVAPSGVITVNSMKGYNKEEEEVSSMIGKAGVGKLEVGGEARRSEVGISVINNQEEKIKNVKILGRIPYAGNKEIVSKKETGSTVDTKLVGGIEGAEVYYSENGEADSDRTKAENGWTTEASERSKSYLIEVGEIEGKGEREYGYEVEVPGGLGLNEESYGVYGVYYNNEVNGGKAEEIEEATKVGVSTGQGPEIEAKLTSNSGETVNTMQAITYRVSMTNTGKMAAENVKVHVDIPEGLVYAEEINDSYSEEQYRPNTEIKEVNLEIGNIEVGETVTRNIVLLPITENANVKLQAIITGDNLEKEIAIESIQTQVIKGAFRITEFGNNSAQTVALGEELIYCAYVRNDSNQTINKVVATTKVDDWLEYQDAWFVHDDNGEIRNATKYNEKDKTVTWNIGAMGPETYVRIFLKAKAVKEGANQIKTAIFLSGDNVQDQNTGEVDSNVEKGKVETKVSCDVEEGYITEGTVLNYTVEVKNTGNLNLNEMEILAKLPEGLSFSQSSYEANGETQYSSVIEGNIAKITYTLNVGETVKATFTVVADEIGEQETKNVTTELSVKATEIGEIKVGTFEHIIEKESSDPDRPGTYHISGIAWLDENKNGAREDNEARLSGIKVKAINSNLNKMVVGENSQVQEAITGEKGEYSLKGLEKGNYVVVFEYDQNQYSLTEYRKEGVEESRNNDVIKGSIKEGETQREVGLTDTIQIENRSRGNIDIGLVVADQFDLRLDKYVSKITVQDSKGTKSYEYGEEQLAKVELDRKRINGANVIIEYTIRVTNEGNVEGYAKKVIDYMPKELSFNSELNSQWYASEGELVNSSIGKERILPGESKEIKLILTKQMTENGIGIVSNKAEIGESWNEKGLADRDSIAGNRVDGEDDQSKADVLIGIGTGRMIVYIGVTVVLLGLIGAGAYYVNKKVLKV